MSLLLTQFPQLISPALQLTDEREERQKVGRSCHVRLVEVTALCMHILYGSYAKFLFSHHPQPLQAFGT